MNAHKLPEEALNATFFQSKSTKIKDPNFPNWNCNFKTAFTSNSTLFRSLFQQSHADNLIKFQSKSTNIFSPQLVDQIHCNFRYFNHFWCHYFKLIFFFLLECLWAQISLIFTFDSKIYCKKIHKRSKTLNSGISSILIRVTNFLNFQFFTFSISMMFFWDVEL